MPALGYCRVSTLHQAEDGDSLANQQRKIVTYCEQNGLHLAASYIDAGVSGALHLADRPEGGKLLAAAQKGDVVVAASLDRCHRSASDALATLESLKARGIGLALLDLGGEVTSGGISGLLFTVMAAVSAFERTVIKERIASVKQMQRIQGAYLGGRRPIGSQLGKDGKLVPDPAEQAAIALVLRLSAQGMSLRKCQAAVLDALGVKMSHTAIRRLLASSRIRQQGAA